MQRTLTTQILSFFAGHTQTSYDMDDLRDIRPYQIGDRPHAVNWKKTATFGRMMTNTYEPDTHLRGQIICVRDSNRNKGRNHSIQHGIDVLISDIHATIAHDPASKIEIITTDRPPTTAQLQRAKTMIISDFFWSEADIHRTIIHCQRGLAHGLIIPILTPL